MSKNIVICCDGTGNRFGAHHTNVMRIVEKVIRNDHQRVFYDPGVGTFNAFGKPHLNKLGLALGKAFGYGLQANIIEAYQYLMEYYAPEDRIFLFGFSRGAFTVRALAGLLHKCGLLQQGHINLLPYLMKIYFKQNNIVEADAFKAAFSRACCPYLIGVWDTVRALGYFLRKKFSNNQLNPNIPYAYHAVSIDEQRQKFDVCLWDESSKGAGQTIRQVWFAGVHSDVGGWYKERSLSDIALQWMLAQAQHHGLLLQEDWKGDLCSDSLGNMHVSRQGFWKLWRPMKRVIPENALIHQSVKSRLESLADYQPSLPKNREFTE